LLAGSRARPIVVGDILLRPGEKLETVAFPTSGCLSLVAQPDETLSVEAATIGREGVGNVHSALGSRRSSLELIGQVSGAMIEVDVELFAKLCGQPGRLQDLVHGYIEALFAQASLSSACNAVHHVNQRCARWLLMSHDRVDSDTFDLKQEFLAVMLGVKRPSVTIAAGTLQEAGLISYKRGWITIVDREALEQAACSCYENIRSEYSRLVPLGSSVRN
jgi:CRP-like cAMP-binding protein